LLLNRRGRATENSVSIDDEEGAVLAMEHLLRHGHRRIACLSGPLMFDTALRRLKGYRRALHTHDIPYEGALVEEIGWGTFDEGAEGMLRLLERKNPPTAVFASSFMVAVGALHAARNRNFRIPEDISIIGFHDASLAKVTAPPLTVVNMPLYQMGREGLTTLVAALTEDAPVKPKVLPPIGVVVRGSTGPPNAAP
jgi:DNA-binding LacI/PurR family transcriptional regulator